MTNYCGVVLTGDSDTPCGVACITDDDTYTASTADDDEIMAFLEEHQPKIIALNAPQQQIKRQGFREGEEELVEDGHAMLPHDMRDKQLLERAEFLSHAIQRSGIGAAIIESKPELISQELNIQSDTGLEAYGIDTDDIEHVREFNALLLALTARLYDEDRAEEKDIIVPKTE